MPAEVVDKLKPLEREDRDLHQASEILRKASAYFAQAKLDRRAVRNFVRYTGCRHQMMKRSSKIMANWRLARPHSGENGQVERINRTIKDAAVKRHHQEMHDHLRQRPDNFGHRVKVLKGLIPCEAICKV